MNVPLRDRVSFAVPVVLATTIVAWGLWRHGATSRGSNSSAVDVQFEAQLNAASLAGFNGKTVQITPGRQYLLLFVNPDADAELLKYLSFVSDPPALEQRLQPILFVSSTYVPDPTRLLDSGAVPFPCVDINRNVSELRKFLHVPNTSRKAILLDTSLRVAFVANFFKKNDARALFDRYASSQWSRYSRATITRPISPGDQMPHASVKDLWSGELVERLPPDVRTWVILTARCTSCTLANTMAELARLHLPDSEWRHIALLFSRYFPEAIIVPRLRALNLNKLRVYIATSELVGLEDPYLQQSLGPDSAIDVELDDSGNVASVRRFDAFVSGHLNNKEDK